MSLSAFEFNPNVRRKSTLRIYVLWPLSTHKINMYNKNNIRSCNDNPSLNLIYPLLWPRPKASTFSDPKNYILGFLKRIRNCTPINLMVKPQASNETWIQWARHLTVLKPVLYVINVAKGNRVLAFLPWSSWSLELMVTLGNLVFVGSSHWNVQFMIVDKVADTVLIH